MNERMNEWKLNVSKDKYGNLMEPLNDWINDENKECISTKSKIKLKQNRKKQRNSWMTSSSNEMNWETWERKINSVSSL